MSLQAVSALERGFRKAPYRDTVERLANALGLTGETRKLFEHAAERARMRSAPYAPTEPSDQHHNLPPSLTSFVGRDAVVAELASLLEARRLLTIVGSGGAGKTRVALELARGALQRWTDGIWLVELGGVRDPSLVPSAVAEAIAAQESPRRSILETVLKSLSSKQTLLIVDNCEHLLGAVRELAAAILRGCSGVSLLLTSREALRISGEHAYVLPPLDVPRGAVQSREEALRFASVALFVDRAAAADARFMLREDNAPTVAAVCRRLDGIPLAIELAAARSTMFSPAELLARLDERLGLLSRAQHDAVPRQRTMRALIDWSYELLDARERVLFSRLAVFAGGFSLDSVAEVCADGDTAEIDVLDLLGSLIEKSLVVAEISGDEGRYRLLEPTRDYALEKLRERGEVPHVAQRHALAFLRLARRLDGEWYGATERTWFARADADLDNFRAALDFACASDDSRTVPEMTAALARVFYSLAPAEGQRRTHAALDALDGNAAVELRAWLEIATAEYDNAFGEYKAAVAAAERALPLLANVDAPILSARAQQAAGAAYAVLGDGARATSLLESALALARERHCPRLVAVVFGELGTACSRRDDLTGARAYYAQALALCSLHGFERLCASLLAQSGEIAFASGDAAEALRYAESALTTHRALRNRRAVAAGLCNATAYLIALNRLDEARIRGREGLAAARDVHGRLYTAYALQHLASIAALRDAGAGADMRGHERAAGLLGFVDGRLTALELVRERTEQTTYDRAHDAVIKALGSEEFRRLAQHGVQWTDARAFDEAMLI